jgi:hypothetical protein
MANVPPPPAVPNDSQADIRNRINKDLAAMEKASRSLRNTVLYYDNTPTTIYNGQVVTNRIVENQEAKKLFEAIEKEIKEKAAGIRAKLNTSDLVKFDSASREAAQLKQDFFETKELISSLTIGNSNKASVEKIFSDAGHAAEEPAAEEEAAPTAPPPAAPATPPPASPPAAPEGAGSAAGEEEGNGNGNGNGNGDKEEGGGSAAEEGDGDGDGDGDEEETPEAAGPAPGARMSVHGTLKQQQQQRQRRLYDIWKDALAAPGKPKSKKVNAEPLPPKPPPPKEQGAPELRTSNGAEGQVGAKEQGAPELRTSNGVEGQVPPKEQGAPELRTSNGVEGRVGSERARSPLRMPIPPKPQGERGAPKKPVYPSVNPMPLTPREQFRDANRQAAEDIDEWRRTGRSVWNYSAPQEPSAADYEQWRKDGML